ncbi:hypothetical protein [Mesorhizobium sp.]|uniref:hypothetical protein n=1 Tax=Mesorhizobium sp. TaxID=1871066 RepID=UPI0025BA39B4|nr:hypothetical protein [Mesorhizobium sp.]
MSPDQHDYSNLSDEGLQRALRLIRMDLGIKRGRSLKQTEETFAKLQAITAEQKRRA